MTEAAARAYSILCKYEFRMPFEINPKELGKRLVMASHHIINAENIKHLVGIIETRIAKRKRLSLELTSFKHHKVKRKHNLHLLPGMPNFADRLQGFVGVMGISAPKGGGKTENAGIPFVEACENKGLTMASCHSSALTDDLKERLKMAGYKEDHLQICDITGLAICVASIAKDKFSPFIDNVDYVFIDEIKQTLEFLSANECSTKGKTNADVYYKLKRIIANAKAVVVVDADLNDRVIEFLEECRPNERFEIYDIEDSPRHWRHAPENFVPANKHKFAKKNINYIIGDESACYGNILSRLHEDENLWIAVESSEKVRELANFIREQMPDISIMDVNAGNKKNKAQAEFLSNVNKHAPNYQVVIHSPVIRSGVSVVAEPGKEHFDHTFFIGSGHSIVPSDASQMLARVRYVHDYTLSLSNNTMSQDARDHRSVLIGKEQASIQEGKRLHATEFDRFCAQVSEDEHNAKADFVNGLLWLLGREGHKLTEYKDVDFDYTKVIKANKFNTELEWREWVTNAEKLTTDEYFELSSQSANTITETCQIEKYVMCQQLNVEVLEDEHFDLWNGGRVMSEMKRLAACFDKIAFEENDDAIHLHHRKFSKAKVWAYQYLFEGIDIEKGRISQDQANHIIERAIEKRYLLTELGVLPRKYAKYLKLDRKGNDPFSYTRYPKYPMKDVQSIFKRMGLSLNRKDNYHSADDDHKNDYELNQSVYTYKREVCTQIDFSRMGGYCIRENSVSAEIIDSEWVQTENLVVAILEMKDQPLIARSLLDSECEKMGLTSKDPRVKRLYDRINKVA